MNNTEIARKTVVFIFDREYEETIVALAEYLTAPSAANYDGLASIVGLRDANALITSANALILHRKR